MSGEFQNQLPAETFIETCEAVERTIRQAGSVSDYLLEVQVEQARSLNGRAELIRLQRVAQLLADPEQVHEDASTAFYHGALLSSALLAARHPEGTFAGGSLAHNYLWGHIDALRQVYDAPLHTALGRAQLSAMAEEVNSQVLAWAHEEDGDAFEALHTFSEHYAQELHPDAPALQDGVLAGFWIPLSEYLSPEDTQRAEETLAYVNEETQDIPQTHSHLFNGDYDALEAQFSDGIIATESLIPMKKERSAIIKAFKRIHATLEAQEVLIKDMTEYDEHLGKYGVELADFNQKSGYFKEGMTLCLEGDFTYDTVLKGARSQGYLNEGSDAIIGDFAGFTAILAPYTEVSHDATQPTVTGFGYVPAIVLSHAASLMRTGDATETLFHEDTRICIGIDTRTTNISRFES